MTSFHSRIQVLQVCDKSHHHTLDTILYLALETVATANASLHQESLHHVVWRHPVWRPHVSHACLYDVFRACISDVQTSLTCKPLWRACLSDVRSCERVRLSVTDRDGVEVLAFARTEPCNAGCVCSARKPKIARAGSDEGKYQVWCLLMDHVTGRPPSSPHYVEVDHQVKLRSSLGQPSERRCMQNTSPCLVIAPTCRHPWRVISLKYQYRDCWLIRAPGLDTSTWRLLPGTGAAKVAS